MPTGPLTAVIVTGTNERPWLAECLLTVRASGHPLIIYVDNASADGSAEYVRNAFSDVEVITLDENLGYAGANNAGMRVAVERGARYAFLLNPDTRTPAALIPTLTSFMELNPEYGIIGPLQTVYDATSDVDTPQPYNDWSRHALANGERNVFHHDAPRHRSHASPPEGRAAGTLEHAYVQGAALFARLDAVERAGLLDPLYHTYYEETDLCRRVRWHGDRVALLLGPTIQHKGGGSAPASPYRSYHMLRNRFLFAYTDPTWTVGELIRLTVIWTSQIVRPVTGGRRTADFSASPEIAARVLGWLVRNAREINERRRRNAAVVQAGTRRP